MARALRDAGYEVAVCASAADGVRVAALFRPDLVMLEMVLGRQVEGPSLVRRLRAESDPLVLL